MLYEKISLSHSCPWVSSSGLLCRTTSSLEGSCFATTTAAFVLQRERIRCRHLRDICNRDERRGGTRTTDFADGDVVTISGGSGSPHGWGGGMDFTYFLPWKWIGFRFQGAGVELSSSTETGSITGPNNSFHFSRSNSFSTGAGVITGDIILRLPLDDFWPNIHLAPYVIGGGGGVFTGSGGNTINTRFPELNQRFNNASSNVENDRGLGHLGGGFEYRFTPHIGIFGEATYNWAGGGQHNFNSSVKDFVQTNFGLRFAF